MVIMLPGDITNSHRGDISPQPRMTHAPSDDCSLQHQVRALAKLKPILWEGEEWRGALSDTLSAQQRATDFATCKPITMFSVQTRYQRDDALSIDTAMMQSRYWVYKIAIGR